MKLFPVSAILLSFSISMAVFIPITAAEAKPNFEMEIIIKDVFKAITHWKKIAKEIGISRAEQELMAPAFRVLPFLLCKK